MMTLLYKVKPLEANGFVVVMLETERVVNI